MGEFPGGPITIPVIGGSATGGYVDTLRVDWTGVEKRVQSTYELRIHVDTSQLTDEEFVTWLQSNANRLHAAGIFLPVDLVPSPDEL